MKKFGKKYVEASKKVEKNKLYTVDEAINLVKETTTSTTKKKSTTKTKKLENNIVAEYYDLPYRYNETVVKILYQYHYTPKL